MSDKRAQKSRVLTLTNKPFLGIMFAEKEYLARTVSTGKNYAYLKIGEGCSNMCTYCAIPYIRGLFISRPMEDILEEAKREAEMLPFLLFVLNLKKWAKLPTFSYVR